MSKHNQERDGSLILLFAFCVTITIVAIKYAPKDPVPLKIEPQEVVYEYPEPVSHRYPCNNKGTLRYCPVHKQKGVEITSKNK